MFSPLERKILLTASCICMHNIKHHSQNDIIYYSCTIDIYYFNFAGAVGRYLRIIQRSNNEPLNIAEVKVIKAPALATGQTPYEHRYHTPVNAIVQGVAMATQSSTCWGSPASNAINGDHGDFSHTCVNSNSPAWWMVDFGDGNDNTAVREGMFISLSFGVIPSCILRV